MNKKQQQLLHRLNKLNATNLQTISRHTSLFSYQRGSSTINRLKNLVSSTKSRNILSAVNDVVSLYEQYGTQEGLSNVVNTYLEAHKNDEAGRFIRILRDRKGWNDLDIVIVLEQAGDTLQYIPSKVADNMETLDDFYSWMEENAIY